jgi:hypothetical protein
MEVFVRVRVRMRVMMHVGMVRETIVLALF